MARKGKQAMWIVLAIVTVAAFERGASRFLFR